MAKAFRVLSAICLIVALATFLLGILALCGISKSWYIGFAMFNLIKGGTFMGFLGSILSIIFTGACYGAMGYYGLSGDNKKAFVWSACASALAIVSLVIVIFSHKFTFGDLFITALPLAYLGLVLKKQK